jgi:hypothetical protein
MAWNPYPFLSPVFPIARNPNSFRMGRMAVHFIIRKLFRKRNKYLLIFSKISNKEITMANEMVCPICDADIPLDGDEESGDLLMCSYCKMTLKILRTRDKWTLVEDFEE